MNTLKIIGLILLFMQVRANPARGATIAGEPVQKVITKDIRIDAGDMLRVVGEKARIHISGWSNTFVRMKITFRASHQDKAIATRELGYLQYSLSREHHTVEIRNGFMLPPFADNIQSRLDVLIELMVPAENTLAVVNKYGDISLRNLTRQAGATMEFCNLTLDNVRGRLTLRSSYSEIHGRNIATSSLDCHDEQSQIDLELNAGACTFNSRHSELDLTLKDISALKIESSRTSVTIRVTPAGGYRYKLASTDGDIYAPEFLMPFLKREGNNAALTTKGNAEKHIQVTTTYNTITIKE